MVVDFEPDRGRIEIDPARGDVTATVARIFATPMRGSPGTLVNAMSFDRPGFRLTAARAARGAGASTVTFAAGVGIGFAVADESVAEAFGTNATAAIATHEPATTNRRTVCMTPPCGFVINRSMATMS